MITRSININGQHTDNYKIDNKNNYNNKDDDTSTNDNDNKIN